MSRAIEGARVPVWPCLKARGLFTSVLASLLNIELEIFIGPEEINRNCCIFEVPNSSCSEEDCDGIDISKDKLVVKLCS